MDKIKDFLGAIIALVVIIGIIILIIKALRRRRVKPFKNWQYAISNEQYSSQDFFANIEEEVKRHKMPNVTFSRKKFFQTGVHSARREYLRISYDIYVMDIGCTAFGTDRFFSWWLGSYEPALLSVSRIPILNTLLGKNPDQRTYYQEDTASMFQSTVHNIITALLDDFMKDRGLRPLSDTERMPKDRKK